tara:strand:- start:3188 stop:3775 length:588 start_codon:yes stop_codon:yes gene_type:complete
MAYFDDRPLFVDQPDIEKTMTSDATNLNDKAVAMECFIPYFKDKSVTDLGCADGRFCSWFLDKGGVNAHGIDIKDTYIDQAKSNMANYFANDQYSFEVGDITLDTFTSSKHYDVVALMNVLNFKLPFKQVEKACNLSRIGTVLVVCAEEVIVNDTGELYKIDQIKDKFVSLNYTNITDLHKDGEGRMYFVAQIKV